MGRTNVLACTLERRQVGSLPHDSLRIMLHLIHLATAHGENQSRQTPSIIDLIKKQKKP